MSDQDPPESFEGKGTKKPTEFGWYNSPKESPKKLDEGDDISISKEPSLGKKEDFLRVAAVKCAQMEEELSSLMANKLGGEDFAMLKGEVYLNKFGDLMQFSSYEEPFQGIKNGQLKGRVNVNYEDYRSGFADHAEKLGIKTARRLIVGIHMDEPTQEAYNQAINSNPMLNDTDTMFFFTQEGEYRKFLLVDRRVPIDFSQSKSSYSSGDFHFYESEMTYGDFEIAGQALVMLKNRLIPKPPTENP